MSTFAGCDSHGCHNDAEWKDSRGNRWCDGCKRDLANYEAEANYYHRTDFRHEKRAAPASSEKAAVEVSAAVPIEQGEGQ